MIHFYLGVCLLRLNILITLPRKRYFLLPWKHVPQADECLFTRQDYYIYYVTKETTQANDWKTVSIENKINALIDGLTPGVCYVFLIINFCGKIHLLHYCL